MQRLDNFSDGVENRDPPNGDATETANSSGGGDAEAPAAVKRSRVPWRRGAKAKGTRLDDYAASRTTTKTKTKEGKAKAKAKAKQKKVGTRGLDSTYKGDGGGGGGGGKKGIFNSHSIPTTDCS